MLTSDSVTDAADRLEFASAVAQQDNDLATQVSRADPGARRGSGNSLTEAAQEQQAALEQLKAQEASINAKLADYESAWPSSRTNSPPSRRRPPSVGPSTDGGDDTNGNGDGPDGDGNRPADDGFRLAIQTCPVAGPNSFVDSFGDPRPGGRTHDGDRHDRRPGHPRGGRALAARCTAPAARSAATASSCSTTAAADWTFYTHFDRYGAYGEGAHVSAPAR